MGLGQDVLILGAADVDRLLAPEMCVAAVEEAFRERGQGATGPTGVLGVHAGDGGFHVKAAATPGFQYFAAKINANFPRNPERYGLPTIQGAVTLFDGTRGTPLAILDSVRITALRTAAASAVAARYLAKSSASSLGIIGCGTQALAHFDAIRTVRPLARVRLYDARPDQAEQLANRILRRGVRVDVARSIRDVAQTSEIIVTCTPSTEPILGPDDVLAGAFVAAVGADSEHKLEISPALMRRARVVVDLLEQCVAMGDLRGAIAGKAMRREDVHAELAEVVAGRRPGRTGDDEVFLFDSTGVAFEDVAAAVVVYQRARARGYGRRPLPHLTPFIR